MSEKGICEIAGCTMPGTICPACQQCLCWRHLADSTCDVCQVRRSHGTFEHYVARFVTIGASVMLCSLLFFMIPRDDNSLNIQIAIASLIAGFVLLWFGLIART